VCVCVCVRVCVCVCVCSGSIVAKRYSILIGYSLTEELMPVLKKSAPACVVTVASGGKHAAYMALAALCNAFLSGHACLVGLVVGFCLYSNRWLFVWLSGMYSVSLDTEDPQCRNMKKYDGTTVYAQNKVCDAV